MSDKLRLENVSFRFGNEPAIIDSVDFAVPDGGTVVITGRSGSGKSTLLEICAGLLEPNSGSVMWDGRDIKEYSRDEIVEARTRMGFVFQKHALISNFTIFENVALPLRYHLRLPEQELRERVSGHMGKMGIEALAAKLPEQLSLGQTRWVSIARALVMDPDLLFFDEPVSGLDPVTAHTIIHIIDTIRKQKNLTIIMVSHILHIIKMMNSPVAVLENGRLTYMEHFGSGASGANSGILTFLNEEL